MREFLERISGGGAAEEIFEVADQIKEAAAQMKEEIKKISRLADFEKWLDDAADQLNDAATQMKKEIKKIEGGLSTLANFEKWLDDNAETADKLAKLEAEFAQAKEEIKWLNEEIEEKQNILDAVKDRGVAHEYGCKFYIGATCRCLPPGVAEWLAT